MYILIYFHPEAIKYSFMAHIKCNVNGNFPIWVSITMTLNHVPFNLNQKYCIDFD